MARSQNSPCVTVGTGGVGESGASSQVVHQVQDNRAKMMVLRKTDSSLCPNTGAAAVLVIDGNVEAWGILTGAGGGIQAEAPAGAWVIGIVHTFPLFNQISCVRLGELSYRLEECDLVAVTGAATTKSASLLPCGAVDTRDWYAWNNLMPPPPDDFHVVGEVQVRNPGVEPELVPRPSAGKPAKGKKSKTLGLDLVLVQRPGIWPDVLAWKQVRYDKVLVRSGYDEVEIYCADEVIQTVPVENVS